MGKIDCEIHGDTWMTLGCRHISVNVRAGHTTKDVVRCLFEDPEGRGRMYDYGALFYCRDCVEAFQLPPEAITLPNDRRSEMYHSNERFVPVCWYCFVGLNPEVAESENLPIDLDS